VNARLRRRILEHFNHVPQHSNTVTPRVLKVDGCMTLLGDDQRKTLIKPPDRQTHKATIHAKQIITKTCGFCLTYPQLIHIILGADGELLGTAAAACRFYYRLDT